MEYTEFVVPLIRDFGVEFKKFSSSLKKNELKLVEVGSKQHLWNVLQNLPYEAHMRFLNREIEIKYSDLPILRSLKLSNILNSQLKGNSDSLENFVKENIGLESSLLFHQIFHRIREIAFNNNGIIYVYDLDGEPFKKEILKVIELISVSESDIKSDYSKFESRFLEKKTFLHDENPFYIKPFFKHIIDGKQTFICPSPSIFLFSMGWTFFSLISKFCENIIGDAYSQYVKDLLTFYNLDPKSFDEPTIKVALLTENKENGDDCADYWIETEKYIFIIECKNSLGLRVDFSKTSGTNTLLNRWNRIAKGLNQLSSTKKNIKDSKGKEVCCLIVANETVITEGATFFLYAMQAKQLEKLGLELGKVSIVSIAQFENIIASGSLDRFAETCLNGVKELAESRVEFPEMIKLLNVLFEPFLPLDLCFWDNERQLIDKHSISQVAKELERVHDI